MIARAFAALSLALALALAGCGGPSANAHSKDVGGQCTTDKDCTNRCSLNSDLGSGYCTRSCTTDKDCPDHSACISKEGGICAVTCTTTPDCSDFGRGFVCEGVSRYSGGSVSICRLP